MRVFVAIELDEAVTAAAADAAERLRLQLQRKAPDIEARWVAPGNFHLTLWFIGEVPDRTVDAISTALQRLSGVCPPFDIELAGCGAFPPSGAPRVFWIGMRRGAASTKALYAATGAALAPLGFLPEKREYSAHLTLARVKGIGRTPARTIRALVAETPASCGVSRVSAVTLFRSRLSPRGSAYEPLLRVPLS